MKDFFYEGTHTLPKVHFNSESGVLLIEGMSITENPNMFYGPMLEWLETYSKNPVTKTCFEIKLKYFNSSTSKRIYDMLCVLESMYKNGNDVQVNWYVDHDDAAIVESGEELSTMINVPFEVISI